MRQRFSAGDNSRMGVQRPVVSQEKSEATSLQSGKRVGTDQRVAKVIDKILAHLIQL